MLRPNLVILIHVCVGFVIIYKRTSFPEATEEPRDQLRKHSRGREFTAQFRTGVTNG